ncbi:MAG TPA: dihydroxyacetone kinase subunit L [Phycisphaerales bacterium]|nr:dihydroxyacetone kinase subunit L [Phycisphaerales bacterium]
MNAIGYEDIKRMLLAAAELIRAHHQRLSELDSFGGDGDHGTTMVRAMGCLEKGMAQAADGRIDDLLNQVGWAILGVDGGATGPLFGSLFMGMGQAVGDRDAVDVVLLADMFEAARESVANVTQAQVGDKTLVDALVPAVTALRAAADKGEDVLVALDEAARAAQQGAEGTRDMAARFGRARNRGEASKGQPDPGATSMALVFQGFAQGVRTHGGS